jgi:hypothetical protein
MSCRSVDRNPERPGAHRGLGRVGVGLGDDAGDQRPVGLPVQALPVPGEQAAERERGGGPLDEHRVGARGGPSQTRITRPQSSPRAPTGVNSQPDASS